MDRRVFLKVKLKSLAEEARIIKREENKRKVRRFRCNNQKGSEYVQVDAREVRKDSQRRSHDRRAKSWYPLSAQELHQLHRHRIDVVRREARATSIAYAIIRGRMLKDVDSGRGLTVACMEKIQKMVKRYGNAEDSDQQFLQSMTPQEALETFNTAIQEFTAERLLEQA